MRPGEFNRYLDAEQQRAALLGRQWHAQRRVDIAMNGADERDTALYPPAPRGIRAYLAKAAESQETFPLSATWWHG